ncbi:MGH1-like glycoside hydrolase domain-containing protein [Aestuariimicrobium ganziense]|uniref:MGH1-like glycoside hydrolase domain-containing protein n=1 Tax=Aestuariimicrobium ganziense TaxID=2773677 RepID=UPI0019407C35|nr:hypothetical protein [Aestuariimicrobium ganziense]
MATFDDTAEGRRLHDSPTDDCDWRRWGPYVAARQWGTVREDYSPDGNAWEAFPFDQSHQRVYRWGEDGLAGLCDRFGFANLAIALWNGNDDRLKERPFGLTNPQGNHGEDVKEYYWALDGTPTHSWAQWLYRYPQAAYPYADLIETNAKRGQLEREYELSDTGVLDDNRFFDVTVTHAKVTPHDICMVVEATNHGPDPAPLHLVPQYWFRNTWIWGRDDRTPTMGTDPAHDDWVSVTSDQAWLGEYRLAAEGRPQVLFCDNETNAEALWGQKNLSPHPKDAINQAVVGDDPSLLNPAGTGTKMGFWYRFDEVAPGETVSIRLRLTKADEVDDDPFGDLFDQTIAARRAEADEFHDAVLPDGLTDNDRHLCRRAFAGLQWGKQLYRYSVKEWLEGDPEQVSPPDVRQAQEPWGRNTLWNNLDLADVISMPDDWEYPWFAAWDLAFHCVALAHVDPAFAKNQLMLLCRDWAQHPNGQLPAYEWSFSDVNPPVHAWAAWMVYLADGREDTDFLSRITTKLLLNFGWWVNRKDESGNNLFEGGFLGLDNISLFDRSGDVPAGWHLEQSDATSWMAFHTLVMMRITQELARSLPGWDETATTFFHRFLSISQAVEAFGAPPVSLWDEDEGFFYDALVNDEGHVQLVPVRSLVGLLPLMAVANSQPWIAEELPDFARRRVWMKEHRPDLMRYMLTEQTENGEVQTLSLVDNDRLPRVLSRLFDPEEFLSPYGIRSLSATYRDGLVVTLVDQEMEMHYVPGESDSRLFGGNSNWRGPVWFPLNCLIVNALRHRADGVGGDLIWEYPTGSGEKYNLEEIADDLSHRLVGMFRPGPDGRRPGTPRDFLSGPLWDEHPVFSEYFNGDTGEGLGATHQTGWTAMVAHLIIEGKTHRLQHLEGEPAEAAAPAPAPPAPNPEYRSDDDPDSGEPDEHRDETAPKTPETTP